MNKAQFLALLEVDEIHNYIFATNKLKEIRGASYLLSEINERKTKEILKSYPNAKVILSTGGVSKVIFHDKNQAHKFLKQMEQVYRQGLVTASVTTHFEAINSDFSFALRKGELAIRRKKEDKEYTFQVNTSGYYKICSLCGEYPASEKEAAGVWLCLSCKRKRENSSFFLDIHRRIAAEIKEKYQTVNRIKFPEQFEDIGKRSRVKNYMGFVVVDGNRMGEKIKLPQVSSDAETYTNFSQKIKECIDEALIEAISESVCGYSEKEDDSLFLPVLVLILGGDDMILVTTPEYALPLASKFCKKFQQKTKEKGLPEISISAGVVISKTTFPIFSYVKLGEELLKSAKRLGRERNKEGKEASTIDFVIVTSSSTKSLEEVREENLYYKRKTTEERFRLTARPYTITDPDYDFKFEELLNLARKFKNSGFPRNKLNGMERYLRTGRENSILEFCTMKLRLKEAHRKLLNEFIDTFKLYNDRQIPWRIEKDNEGECFLTNFLDLVEIYEFT